MIETSLNVTDYPSPPEVDEKTIGGEIRLTFKFEDSVPKSWSKEDIINEVKENLIDYVDLHDYEEIDIDV